MTIHEQHIDRVLRALASQQHEFTTIGATNAISINGIKAYNRVIVNLMKILYDEDRRNNIFIVDHESSPYRFNIVEKNVTYEKKILVEFNGLYSSVLSMMIDFRNKRAPIDKYPQWLNQVNPLPVFNYPAFDRLYTMLKYDYQDAKKLDTSPDKKFALMWKKILNYTYGAIQSDYSNLRCNATWQIPVQINNIFKEFENHNLIFANSDELIFDNADVDQLISIINKLGLSADISISDVHLGLFLSKTQVLSTYETIARIPLTRIN